MMTQAGQFHAVATALVEELAVLLGTLAGTSATVSPSDDLPEPDVAVRVEVTGPWMGHLVLVTSLAHGRQLLPLTGSDPPATDDADRQIGNAFRELCRRACEAVAGHDERRGWSFPTVTVVDASTIPPGERRGRAYHVSAGPSVSMVVGVSAEPATASRPGAPSGPVGQPGTSVAGPGVQAVSPTFRNLDVVLDIDLPLSVRFGEAELTVESLTKLGPGSIIELGRSPDDPVDVLINGRIVARGEVVVVGGNYGVRITEVVSAADRLRSMTA